TNTPLQALAMLNYPLVLEASRVLASNLIARHSKHGPAIEEAFKRIVCRPPTDQEFNILQHYYLDELESFSKNHEKVIETVSVGEHPIQAETKEPETAALMQVIVVLYNLEETITKS